MGQTTENLFPKDTGNKIESDVCCDLRHINIGALKSCNKDNKVFKIENPFKHFEPTDHEKNFRNNSKDHKSVFHSIEQYFTNSISYEKLNKRRKQNLSEFYHTLRKSNIINKLKTNKSFKGCVTDTKIVIQSSIDGFEKCHENNLNSINDSQSLKSLSISSDENNNKKLQGKFAI